MYVTVNKRLTPSERRMLTSIYEIMVLNHSDRFLLKKGIYTALLKGSNRNLLDNLKNHYLLCSELSLNELICAHEILLRLTTEEECSGYISKIYEELYDSLTDSEFDFVGWLIDVRLKLITEGSNVSQLRFI